MDVNLSFTVLEAESQRFRSWHVAFLLYLCMAEEITWYKGKKRVREKPNSFFLNEPLPELRSLIRL